MLYFVGISLNIIYSKLSLFFPPTNCSPFFPPFVVLKNLKNWYSGFSIPARPIETLIFKVSIPFKEGVPAENRVGWAG